MGCAGYQAQHHGTEEHQHARPACRIVAPQPDAEPRQHRRGRPVQDPMHPPQLQRGGPRQMQQVRQDQACDEQQHRGAEHRKQVPAKQPPGVICGDTCHEEVLQEVIPVRGAGVRVEHHEAALPHLLVPCRIHPGGQELHLRHRQACDQADGCDPGQVQPAPVLERQPEPRNHGDRGCLQGMQADRRSP